MTLFITLCIILLIAVIIWILTYEEPEDRRQAIKQFEEKYKVWDKYWIEVQGRQYVTGTIVELDYPYLKMSYWMRWAWSEQVNYELKKVYPNDLLDKR